MSFSNNGKVELLKPTTAAAASVNSFNGSYRGQLKLTVADGTLISEGNTLLGTGEYFVIQYDANHSQAFKLLNGHTSTAASQPTYQSIWVDCPEYKITNLTNQFMNIELDIGGSYQIRKTATALPIGIVFTQDNQATT